MRFRVSAVSGALFALLAGSSACLAADPGYAPHRGAVGGLMGFSKVVADGDYSEGAQPRMAFAANLRYVVNPWLRWQVSPGFLWAGYDHASPLPFEDPNYPGDTTKEEALSLMLPVSAQVQVTQKRGRWVYHVGAGPGVYRVWVENRRKVLKDPVTKRLHRGFYPGVSGQLGAERFLTSLPSTAVEASAAGHWAFADRPEQFPSGFNSAILGIELRVGVNYYFNVGGPAKPKSGSALPPAK
jgi:hypothetical protein